ncbi:MAG: autotransporter-associated beta strand repeat-containing protein [Kiritimatiellae bacterium]|nr:autotransporter-associated beta strand repeat-containing protein [Kiritimatiellia bacterium]
MTKFAVCSMVMVAGAAFAANVTDTEDASWWSLADGVLTLNNSDADISASTNIYTAAIGADVTKIVKTGPGAVRLSGNNPNFAGEIDVQAGILMGWVREKTGSTYTEDNYGHPSQVTVADGATFEMLATPILDAAYTSSRFGESPATEFYVQGTGLNGMGALRRHGGLQKAERSYATVTHVTLTGPTMIWVGMRWGFNGGSCVLDMQGHPLTLKAPGGNRTFNFCREGQTELRNPGDIILDHTLLCIEKAVPKNHSAAQVAGTYMVITNSGVYQFLSGTVKTPLYWDIKSYGGDIQGPNASGAADNHVATFAGNLELLAGTTYLYNYKSTGNPEIRLTGTVNGPGALSTQHSSVQNVRTTLTGGGAGHVNEFAQLHVPYGTVTLTDADRFTITNGATVNGPNKSGKFAATLVVTNTVLFMQPGKNKPLLAVGNSDSRFGVVDIRHGAVVTNDMQFGYANKGAGALYLSGNARLYWHGGGNSNPFLGVSGCAYMGIRDDAVMENLGWFNIGANGGRSFVIQRGGTFRNVKSTVTGDSISTTAFKIGRTKGSSHYYQCGGVQACTGSIWFTWDYPDNVYDSYGAYTVDGANATAEVNDVCYCITFAGTANAGSTAGKTAPGTFGTVNVNHGGTFTVNRMYKTVQNHTSGANWTWSNSKDIAPNTWAWLNFDGGVLKVKGTGDFFSVNGTAEDQRLPTRVTVYAGGATIDTDGKDSTWRLPLLKPYGKGVKSITLADSVLKNANYICPPAVRFEGDGSNVTAVVDFDETLRTNRGVIVTSPGFGFTSAPTVKVEKEVCDNASFYTDATVEMFDFDAADYAHGGLTKRGAGTLTLAAANTYGGATRLEGGTLAFTHTQGYPGGDLEIAAAAVQGQTLASPLLTANTLAFGADKGVRVTEADTLDDKTFGGQKTVATFTNPISLPALTLVSADGTEWTNNRQWHLQLSDGGRTLKFGPARGTQILIR